MYIKRHPHVSIWVEGTPKSLSAERKSEYVHRIREAAAGEIAARLTSGRIDIEIIFAAKDRLLRPDVDNVAKPILDALNGVLYEDDKQVRSVRVVALPLDDAVHMSGPASPAVISRLFEAKEFLVNVYEGLDLDLFLLEPRRR